MIVIKSDAARRALKIIIPFFVIPAVVIVTHDTDFAATVSDRCAMFFSGEAISVGAPRDFFSDNGFYTTETSRLTRGYYDGAVTVDDAAMLCRRNGRRA